MAVLESDYAELIKAAEAVAKRFGAPELFPHDPLIINLVDILTVIELEGIDLPTNTPSDRREL